MKEFSLKKCYHAWIAATGATILFILISLAPFFSWEVIKKFIFFRFQLFAAHIKIPLYIVGSFIMKFDTHVAHTFMLFYVHREKWTLDYGRNVTNHLMYTHRMTFMILFFVCLCVNKTYKETEMKEIMDAMRVGEEIYARCGNLEEIKWSL